MIDVETLIIDELASAIETALPQMTVRRGQPVRMDGDTRGELVFPTVALMWSDANEVDDKSIFKEIELDADTVRIVWRRSRIELPIDLWLYTQTKDQRLDLMPDLRGLLYPFTTDGEPTDLQIEIPTYYGATVRYFVERPSNRDEQSASEGYATMMFRLRAATSLLHHRDMPKTTWTTQLIGD